VTETSQDCLSYQLGFPPIKINHAFGRGRLRQGKNLTVTLLEDEVNIEYTNPISDVVELLL